MKKPLDKIEEWPYDGSDFNHGREESEIEQSPEFRGFLDLCCSCRNLCKIAKPSLPVDFICMDFDGAPGLCLSAMARDERNLR